MDPGVARREGSAVPKPSPVIAPDIAEASTLPAAFYRDPDLYRRALDGVFARSWQFAADLDQVRVPGQVAPFTLLEGSLDEPLLLARDPQDRLHCLSNVCTHRGMLVCEAPGVVPALRCRYHGRRFAHDGRFVSMPEFDGVEGFPSPADDLPRVACATWGRFVFVSLDPEVPFATLFAEIDRRVGFLPLDRMVLDPSRSRDYLVRAHWALYCDNYLEEFHIPYVHAGLSGVLDYDQYRTELFPLANLQLGIARGDADTFDLPSSSPDHGEAVAAFYFWVFPNLMLNVYPWGVSVNLVQPLGVERTRVRFLSYVWDEGRLDRGASASLDRVEREDEAVVESVQRGTRSRLYDRGRYSPRRERGVHHFHRLLAERLA
ncbi:MAG: aromatic ring-hydroxylating dioxygenase subunit alpha [Acidobacteria bacterium]|nr:aromatic ring-hydroxylating dioxygenase subunit alpha [Acidobacteriota bacterium]